MDMILSRGAKFSCNLVPRISKLPSTILRHPRISSYQNTQFLGNLRITSYQLNNYSLFSKQHKYELESSALPCCTKVIQYSTSSKSDVAAQSATSKDCNEPKKVSIFQKMKQLAKDYWHILIPVHLVTSAGWVAIFYTAAKNGVDVMGLLESLHFSEKYLDMLRGSNAGHWAVTYALYKIFTPIRYTATVGGTTMCIRYLSRMGYLKFKDTRRETAKPVRAISYYGVR
ncbi:protein FAM210A isoform X2 [Phymastichus coffea]|uniref:protein FAM210A isoform X2 n=1 Tax=Phymastichus coffea TaxID=108790 RepID=UPI00273C9374|nr:protein FAM210A isoform X2 [Phymastichus coffea]